MTKALAELLDPTRPALVVRYGSTPQRVRPLEGDQLLLGRNRVCHVGLSGPDIAEVHCILSRGRTGWRVLDCGSRIGTRVNGQPIKETLLTDGDTIQIGGFLFEAHLPLERDSASEVNPEQARYLRRSRRRFCRLAMMYRRRLRELGNRPGETDPSARQLAETYRARVREFDQRAQRLELEEQKLNAQRERLEREADSLVARSEEVQEEAERRVADAEALVMQLRRENERLRAKAERPAGPVSAPSSDPQEVAKLREQLTTLRTQVASHAREIEERDRLIEELRQRSGSYPVGKVADIEACEAELNRFRRELEDERQAVDEERRLLEQRAMEMDETMRAMELELSQERARWGRERAELDRLREEIRQERERARRQGGVMERLAPINRLKNGPG